MEYFPRSSLDPGRVARKKPLRSVLDKGIIPSAIPFYYVSSETIQRIQCPANANRPPVSQASRAALRLSRPPTVGTPAMCPTVNRPRAYLLRDSVRQSTQPLFVGAMPVVATASTPKPFPTSGARAPQRVTPPPPTSQPHPPQRTPSAASPPPPHMSPPPAPAPPLSITTGARPHPRLGAPVATSTRTSAVAPQRTSRAPTTRLKWPPLSLVRARTSICVCFRTTSTTSIRRRRLRAIGVGVLTRALRRARCRPVCPSIILEHRRRSILPLQNTHTARVTIKLLCRWRWPFAASLYPGIAQQPKAYTKSHPHSAVPTMHSTLDLTKRTCATLQFRMKNAQRSYAFQRRRLGKSIR